MAKSIITEEKRTSFMAVNYCTWDAVGLQQNFALTHWAEQRSSRKEKRRLRDGYFYGSDGRGIKMISRAYEQLSKENNKMFIVVAGNIGSGKTTLTKKLSKRLGWRPHFESVEENPYLEDFYGDMNRWSFPLQVYFLSHRFNVHRSIEASNFTDIQDRSIYEDAHIFARALFEQGALSPRDYKSYLNLYHSMVEQLRVPDLVIGLKRSLPNLIDRIKSRGRDYEQSYLEGLLDET